MLDARKATLLPRSMIRALASLVTLTSLASLGCGAAAPRPVAHRAAPATSVALSAPLAVPTEPLVISSEPTLAPEPTCATPPTTCTRAQPCAIHEVSLEPDARACVVSAREEATALVTSVRDVIVAGDRAWIETDQGVLANGSRGWEHDVDPRRTDGTVRLVLGGETWRMPSALLLT